jgi:hypothetical protein
MKIPFSIQEHIKSLILILCCASLPMAQENTAAPPSGQTVRPIGMILAIDSAARRITIKTDAGPEMNISFEETTRFLRVAPGAKDLDKEYGQTDQGRQKNSRERFSNHWIPLRRSGD